MEKQEILKELEKQRLREELIKLDNFESYNQAELELEPERRKIKFWQLWKISELNAKKFERAREIFDEKYKKVLQG